MPDTQPKAQAPAAGEPARKRDPILPRLPSLALTGLLWECLTGQARAWAAVPEFLSLGVGPGPGIIFFFHSPGKTTQLKHGCRGGDSQMLNTKVEGKRGGEIWRNIAPSLLRERPTAVEDAKIQEERTVPGTGVRGEACRDPITRLLSVTITALALWGWGPRLTSPPLSGAWSCLLSES